MSCTKNEVLSQSNDTSEQAAQTNQTEQTVKTAQTNQTAQEEITEGLQKLGFHVFPEPVDLHAFTVPGLAGKNYSSDENVGRITLLNFWATWCPPCRVEMPSIEKLQTLMKGINFEIVAISVGENKKTVEDFIKTSGYTFPIYLDESGNLGRIYATQGIPTTYIVNKQGKVLAGAVGAREYDSEELVAILTKLSKL